MGGKGGKEEARELSEDRVWVRSRRRRVQMHALSLWSLALCLCLCLCLSLSLFLFLPSSSLVSLPHWIARTCSSIPSICFLQPSACSPCGTPSSLSCPFAFGMITCFDTGRHPSSER